ncbi:MAG: hypothetical protein GX458_18200, partial [Phyllobacteriaceae bacterium]|nr:hypothetical protein [Phyllobacteriaceae bacterium]
MRSSREHRAVVATVSRALLFTGAVLSAVGSASAGTPYTIDREVDNVRGWTIAANAQRRGCFASATFQSETSIELGLDMRNDSAFMV